MLLKFHEQVSSGLNRIGKQLLKKRIRGNSLIWHVFAKSKQIPSSRFRALKEHQRSSMNIFTFTGKQTAASCWSPLQSLSSLDLTLCLVDRRGKTLKRLLRRHLHFIPHQKSTNSFNGIIGSTHKCCHTLLSYIWWRDLKSIFLLLAFFW